MSTIAEHIERANKTNTLTVPIMSPTKVPAGITQFNFRILPYKHQANNEPFIEVKIHSGIGADKKNFALCPNMFEQDSCPYCNTGKKLRSEVSKEEWNKISKDFYVQRNVYIPGIMRSKTSSAFYFLKVSGYSNFDKEILNILTDSQLKALFNLPEDIPYINLWDLKTGIDLIVKINPKNEKQKNASFTIDKALKQTPAATTKAELELIKESIKNMPDLIFDMKNAYGCEEKINDIFNKQYKKNQTPSNNNSLNTQHSNQSSNQHSNQSPNQSSTSNTSSDNNSSVPQNENYTTDEINVDDINIDEINNSPADNASVNNTVEDDKIDDDFDAIMAEIDKK